MSSQRLYRKSHRNPLSAVLASQAPGEGSRQHLFGLARSGHCLRLGAAAPATVRSAGTLQAAYAQGRQTWDKVSISYSQFVAHLRALGHREAPSHAVDLYLTAACCHGSHLAFRVLEQAFIERSRSAVQQVLRDPWAVEDVLQEVRCRLFVGPASKIVCYKGTGPLGSWVRAIAVNVAKDYLRTDGARRRRQGTQGIALFLTAAEVPLQDDDLVLCITREGRGAACLDAVRSAFQALQPCERQLLHDYYLRGFSIDALAPLCNVNRATVARRIRRATDALHRRLRKRLAALYPREDNKVLDGIALAACRALLVDAAALLHVPRSAVENI